MLAANEAFDGKNDWCGTLLPKPRGQFHGNLLPPKKKGIFMGKRWLSNRGFIG